MLESLSDPQRLHAIMIHLPLGAAAVGLLLILAMAVTVGRIPGLRWAAVIVYLLATIVCFVTVETGEGAADAMSNAGVQFTASVADTLHDHAEMAEKAWMFFAGTTVVLLLAEVRKLRVAAVILAVVLALGTVVWMAWVGHLGGELVYRHGVGVPTSPYNKPPAAEIVAPPLTTQPADEH